MVGEVFGPNSGDWRPVEPVTETKKLKNDLRRRRSLPDPENPVKPQEDNLTDTVDLSEEAIELAKLSGDITPPPINQEDLDYIPGREFDETI